MLIAITALVVLICMFTFVINSKNSNSNVNSNFNYNGGNKDDLEKIVLEMQGDFKVFKQTLGGHADEIDELKAQTKLNVKDIQSLNINIVELSKDMKNYSNVMKDLTEQLKKITQEPAEFNEKIKLGTVVAIITYIITTTVPYLFKK